MKKTITVLLISTIFFATSVVGQTDQLCSDALQEARSYLLTITDTVDYQKVVNLLLYAREICGEVEKEKVNNLIQKAFDLIAAERDRAREAEQTAAKERDIAAIAKREAETKQATALAASALNERNLSSNPYRFINYRLAEEAYFLHPDDVQVRNVFLSATQSFRPHLILRGHEEEILGAVFSEDKSQVLSWSRDGSARVWNLSDPTNPILLRGDTTVFGARFLDNDERIFTWDIKGVGRIWDPKRPNDPYVLEAPEKAIRKVAFSADGDRALSIGLDKIVRVWDLSAPQKPIVLKGHTRHINKAFFVRDEQKVITWSKYDGTLRIWDLTDSVSHIQLTGIHHTYSGIVLSPDTTLVLIPMKDGTAKVWSLENPEHAIDLKGHNGMITNALFSADNKRVITWSKDKTARVWDLDNPQTPIVLQQEEEVSSGRKKKNTIGERIEFEDGNSVVLLPDNYEAPEIKGAAFCADHKSVVTWRKDGNIHLWNLEKLDSVQVLEGNFPMLVSAKFTPNHDKLMIWNQDGLVRIFDLTMPQNFSVFKMRGGKDVVFTADGEKFIAWKNSSVALLQSLDDPENALVLNGHKKLIQGATYAPDENQVLTWSDDLTVRIWDLSAPVNPIRLEDRVSDMTLTADRKQVLYGTGDGTVKIWSLEDPSDSIFWKRHRGRVEGTMFTKNEEEVISWGRDSTVHLWDLSSPAHPVISIRNSGRVRGAAITADKEKMLTWGDTTVYLWNLVDSTKTMILESLNREIEGCAFVEQDQKVMIWDDESVRLRYLGDSTFSKVLTNNLNSELYFSEDRNLILFCGYDTAYVWNMSGFGPPLRTPLSGSDYDFSYLDGVQFIPDGEQIILWHLNHIMVWDLKTPNNPRVLSTETYLSITPDKKRLLSLDDDNNMRIWNLEKLSDPPILLNQHPSFIIRSTVFSANGKQILTWSGNNYIHIWSFSNPEEPIVLQVDEAIRKVTFTADEQRILVQTNTGLWLWDLDIERVIHRLYQKFPVMMRQPLEEAFEIKYGLQALYLKRMKPFTN